MYMFFDGTTTIKEYLQSEVMSRVVWTLKHIALQLPLIKSGDIYTIEKLIKHLTEESCRRCLIPQADPQSIGY